MVHDAPQCGDHLRDKRRSARLISAAGLPFLFVPINAVAYVGLRQNQTAQASSLLNVFRNLGGTLGIATAQTLLAHQEQIHQSRLVEFGTAAEPELYRLDEPRVRRARGGGRRCQSLDDLARRPLSNGAATGGDAGVPQRLSLADGDRPGRDAARSPDAQRHRRPGTNREWDIDALSPSPRGRGGRRRWRSPPAPWGRTTCEAGVGDAARLSSSPQAAPRRREQAIDPAHWWSSFGDPTARSGS